MKQTALILAVCINFVSCMHADVYERTVVLPGQLWFYNNQPSFSFTISDTTPAYNIYVVLRHTDAYQYNNIWLNLGSRSPGDSTRLQTIDITLGSDKNGWVGTGMDDIFELRKKITTVPVSFKKPGNYIFTIGQVMRVNPLKHILNIGIRIEKVRL